MNANKTKTSRGGVPPKKVVVNADKLQTLIQKNKDVTNQLELYKKTVEQFEKQKATGAHLKGIKRNKRHAIKNNRLAAKVMNVEQNRKRDAERERERRKPMNGGFIMGRTQESLPEVATSDLVRKVNVSQFYLYWRQPVMDAISRRFPNEVVNFNGSTFGQYYLLFLFLMKQGQKAARGEMLDITEAPITIWNKLHLFSPTTRSTQDRGVFSYAWDMPEKLMGLRGLFTDKPPAVVANQSLSWPNGDLTLGGQKKMVPDNLIVPLSDEAIIEIGQSVVWPAYITYMSSGGSSIVPEPSEGSRHDTMRSSVALFCQGETTGGYSICGLDNTSGEFPRTLGMGVRAEIEVPLHDWEIPWALCCMAEFDEAVDPLCVYTGFNGVVFAGLAEYQGIFGRQSGKYEVYVPPISVEQIVHQHNILVVGADTNRQMNDTIKGPLVYEQGQVAYKQTPVSVFNMVGTDDYLQGLMLALTQSLAQNAWIASAFVYNSRMSNVFCGSTMVGGFSSIEVNLPSPISEALRSLMVTARPEKGSQKHYDCYIPNYFVTGVVSSNIIAPLDPLLPDMVVALDPKLSSVEYNFAPNSGLPDTWSGGKNENISWVDTDAFEQALTKYNSMMSDLKSYLLLQLFFTGQNDPKQTLQYYLNVCSLEQVPNVASEYGFYNLFDLDYINNRDTLNKEYIGWDASHFLPCILLDPTEPALNRIDLQWVQNHYKATNRLSEKPGVLMLEFDQNSMVQNISERGGDGYSEVQLMDKTHVCQALGGGQSTFVETAKGLLPVAGNILSNFFPTPIGNLVKGLTSGVSGLLGAKDHGYRFTISPQHKEKIRFLRKKEKDIKDSEESLDEYSLDF